MRHGLWGLRGAPGGGLQTDRARHLCLLLTARGKGRVSTMSRPVSRQNRKELRLRFQKFPDLGDWKEKEKSISPSPPRAAARSLGMCVRDDVFRILPMKAKNVSTALVSTIRGWTGVCTLDACTRACVCVCEVSGGGRGGTQNKNKQNSKQQHVFEKSRTSCPERETFYDCLRRSP